MVNGNVVGRVGCKRQGGEAAGTGTVRWWGKITVLGATVGNV